MADRQVSSQKSLGRYKDKTIIEHHYRIISRFFRFSKINFLPPKIQPVQVYGGKTIPVEGQNLVAIVTRGESAPLHGDDESLEITREIFGPFRFTLVYFKTIRNFKRVTEL